MASIAKDIFGRETPLVRVYRPAKEAVKPQLPSNCFRAKPEKVSEILAPFQGKQNILALWSQRGKGLLTGARIEDGYLEDGYLLPFEGYHATAIFPDRARGAERVAPRRSD